VFEGTLKVECLLNCPNCDKELLHDDAVFCPHCGEPITPETDVKKTETDLVLAAAISTILAAVFSAALGYIAIYQYLSLLSFYDQALLQGFLILGAFAIVASAAGLAGGIYMLKRTRFQVTVLGFGLLLVSVVVSYVTIQSYQYSFSEVLLFSEISVFMLSILSGALVFSSKGQFE